MDTDFKKIKAKFYDIASAVKKDRKTFLVVVICLIVSFLLVISEFKIENKEQIKDESNIQAGNYINKEEIEDFLENVYGAGEVEIMITYDSSKEYIYAKDTNENTRDKNNINNEINYKSEHIIIKEDGNEKGLMIKEIYPEIRGIAVVCDGGNNPVIKEQLVSILSALFGINTNRISVAARCR